MFYRQQSNQHISENTPFSINGISYPPQWINQSTLDQKNELGLEEVIETGERKDPVYYWTGEILEGATLTFTATPKDLVDTQKQSVSKVNTIAYSLLLPSDWMVVKSVETSTPIPKEWLEWRESIRATAANTITLINESIDVDEIANAMKIVWTNNPDVVDIVSEETI